MKFQLSHIRFPTISTSTSSSHVSSQDYLVGLRGLFVLQSFLFIFFQTFLPTAVADSANTSGPHYSTILRKTLSILFWNESLIYSFLILLSARTICLPFLLDTNRSICASSIFRRGLRLWIPTFTAFSLSAAVYSSSPTSTQYVSDFLSITGNISTTVPLRFPNFLVYFNSLFELFWVTKNYSTQAANHAFPSGTLWIVSVLFQQSYTVYMTMIVVPYTRPSWRVKALGVFVVTAWWVQSWAWYSVTGLLIADAVLNMKFRARSLAGIEVGRWRVPIWPLYLAMVVMGVLLQYLFVAWRPEYRNVELEGHTGLYNSGSLNGELDLNEPQARDDNYLIVLGVMLLVESFEGCQNVLRWRVFVGLGKRSFSVFLVQSLIVYTAGIRLYLYVHGTGANHEVATFVCFIVCLPLVALASEIFYRAIDIPSVAFARKCWVWIRK